MISVRNGNEGLKVIKTKVIDFGCIKADINKLKFECQGENLETVCCLKYLSVIMDYNDSLEAATEELHQKASCVNVCQFL